MAVSIPRPNDVTYALEGLAQVITGGLLDGLKVFQEQLGKITSVIVPFVDAISPGTVQDFNRAMRDFSATIGSGLVASLQVFSSVVREVSGAVLPLVQKMEPIFTSLASAIGTVLTGAVRVWVDAMTGSIPKFQILADVITSLARFADEAFAIIQAGIRTWQKFLAGLFGGSGDVLKDAMTILTATVHQVTKALVTLVATLLAAAGAKDTLKDFADALAAVSTDRAKKPAGLTAAANNPQFADLAAIMKSQQLAAFNAAGAGGAEKAPVTDLDFLKDIAKSVKGIADTKKSFGEALNEWWGKEVVAADKPLARALKAGEEIGKWAGEFWTKISEKVKGWISDLGTAITARLPAIGGFRIGG